MLGPLPRERNNEALSLHRSQIFKDLRAMQATGVWTFWEDFQAAALRVA
jgi:hypothetical protein